MPFSTLSEQEVQEIRSEAANPAYRHMNQTDARLSRRLLDATPQARFAQLISWLEVLAALAGERAPRRDIPITTISRL